MASHFHGTDEPIVYLRTAFGPLAGFQATGAFYLALPLGWTIPIGAFLVCGILLRQVEWLSLLMTAAVLLIGAGI